MGLSDLLATESNRTGLSLWIGTAIVAAIQYFILHQTPATADLLGAVVGLLKILQPDANVTVTQLASEITAVKALIAAPDAAKLGAVINDTEALVAGAVNNPTAAKAGKL